MASFASVSPQASLPPHGRLRRRSQSLRNASERGAISPSRGNQGGDGGGATATAEQQALQYQLVVTREGDVTVEWSLESNVGPSWNGGNGNSPFGGFGAPGQPAAPLRVGLPVRIRGQVRLRPDEATGAVKEVWIKALSINERPLLPKLLSQWVQQGGAGAQVRPWAATCAP